MGPEPVNPPRTINELLDHILPPDSFSWTPPPSQSTTTEPFQARGPGDEVPEKEVTAARHDASITRRVLEAIRAGVASNSIHDAPLPAEFTNTYSIKLDDRPLRCKSEIWTMKRLDDLIEIVKSVVKAHGDPSRKIRVCSTDGPKRYGQEGDASIEVYYRQLVGGEEREVVLLTIAVEGDTAATLFRHYTASTTTTTTRIVTPPLGAEGFIDLRCETKPGEAPLEIKHRQAMAVKMALQMYASPNCRFGLYWAAPYFVLTEQVVQGEKVFLLVDELRLASAAPATPSATGELIAPAVEPILAVLTSLLLSHRPSFAIPPPPPDVLQALQAYQSPNEEEACVGLKGFKDIRRWRREPRNDDDDSDDDCDDVGDDGDDGDDTRDRRRNARRAASHMRSQKSSELRNRSTRDRSRAKRVQSRTQVEDPAPKRLELVAAKEIKVMAQLADKAPILCGLAGSPRTDLMATPAVLDVEAFGRPDLCRPPSRRIAARSSSKPKTLRRLLEMSIYDVLHRSFELKTVSRTALLMLTSPVPPATRLELDEILGTGRTATTWRASIRKVSAAASNVDSSTTCALSCLPTTVQVVAKVVTDTFIDSVVREVLVYTRVVPHLSYEAQALLPQYYGLYQSGTAGRSWVLVLENGGRSISEEEWARSEELRDRVSAAFGLVAAEGLIHRDTRCDNVLIRPDGRLCLVDWGEAWILATRPFTALGSPSSCVPTISTRRIPISHPPPAPSAGGGANQAPGAWASSLDLVFSFSRSAAFFGENLPSGPSFVDSHRYRRPPHLSGDDPDADSSINAPSDRERDHSEDRDESNATSEDDWSVDELDEGLIQSWDGDRPPSRREQLPSNALLPPNRKRRTKSSSARPSSNEGSPASTDRLPYVPQSLASSSSVASGRAPEVGVGFDRQLDERSPLIAPPSTRRAQTSFSPPSPAAFPARPNPLLSPSYNPSSKQQRLNSNGARRLSIISSEAWSAAIEEQRGESTWGQTLFNTVNVLIGVGLLAEPLAFADAGWVIGTILLLFCALVTNYTGKMLASIMRQDLSLSTYADVLIKAYGSRAKNVIYALFVLELGALSIALCVLFADSMESLFPSISSQGFKIVFFFVILPTTFLPLRFLSLTSLIGIISSFTLLFVLVTDGSLKAHHPGSLRDPMPTSVGPRWMRLPLSFGLLMSGFAGHAVIPSLYRDMKNPRQFGSMINTAYVIAFVISMLFGTLGYLMFGQQVSSEVTRDLLATRGNPAALNKVAVWMVALNPVVKYAVANAPLVQTFEVMLGIQKSRAETDRPSRPRFRSPHHSSASAILDGSAIASEVSSSSLSGLDVGVPRPSKRSKPFLLRHRAVITRPLLTALIVVLAIVIPDFARVLSFLGSASAFIICCIGPIGAYLILGSPKHRGGSKGAASSLENVVSSSSVSRTAEIPVELVVGGLERIVCWLLLVFSVLLAVTGTIWSFLPVDRMT